MNERIKELVVQSGGNFANGSLEFAVVFGELKDLEKFTELIITECTQLLFAESERLYAYSSECDIMSRSEDAELCAEKCMDNILMIEQHFGVKE